MNDKDLALRECVGALNVAKASLWNAVKTALPLDAYIFQSEYDQCLTAITKAEAALSAPIQSHDEWVEEAVRLLANAVGYSQSQKMLEYERALLAHLRNHPAVVPSVGPVIVAADADASAMNLAHGESYGVDWVYPPKVPEGFVLVAKTLEERLLSAAINNSHGSGDYNYVVWEVVSQYLIAATKAGKE